MAMPALLLFVSTLLTISVSGVVTPTASTLQFTPAFFQSFFNSMSDSISATVSSFYFETATNGSTNSCDQVTINAGNWITDVKIPSNTATIGLSQNHNNNHYYSHKNSFSSSTTPSILVQIGNVAIENNANVNGMNWTAQVSSTVGNSAVADQHYTTCFQVCLGYTPYSVLTDLESTITFNIGPGSPVSVGSVGMNFVHNTSSGWNLPVQVKSNDCPMAHPSIFNQLFNEGIANTVPANMAAVNAQVAQVLNSILLNTTTDGFCQFSSSTADGALLRSCAGGSITMPPFAAFPASEMGGSSTTSVQMVLQMTSQPIPGTLTPSCVTIAGPCGAPVSGPNSTLQNIHCAACLQQVNGTVFLAFSSQISLTASSSKGLTRVSSAGRRKTEPRSVVKKQMNEELGQKTFFLDRRYRQRQQQRPFAKHKSANDAGATNKAKKTLQQQDVVDGQEIAFLSVDFLTEVVQLAGEELYEKLMATISNGTQGGQPQPLAGAEDYCNVLFDSMQWILPEAITNAKSIPLSVVSVTPTSSPPNSPNATTDGVNVVVSIPLLSSLQTNTVPFSSSCVVPLPFGTNLSHQISGSIVGTMSASSSSSSSSENNFSVSLHIGNGGIVTVVDLPSLTSTITRSYQQLTSKTVFEAYLNVTLFDTLAGSLISATDTLLLDTMTTIWVAKLSSVLSQFQGTAQVGFTPSALFSGAVMLGTLGGFSSMPTLEDVVPASSSSSTSNVGIVQADQKAPPFNVTPMCSTEAACSESIPVPTIGVVLQLVNCSKCVRAINGTIFFGGRADVLITKVPQTTRSITKKSQGGEEKAGKMKHESITTKFSLFQHSTGKVPSISSGTRKQILGSAAQRRSLSSAKTARDTKFYLSIASLTLGVSSVNAAVSEALRSYSHTAASNLSLPFLPNCNISHSSMEWTNAPVDVSLQAATLSPSTTKNNAVTVSFSLSSFPQALLSSSMAFEVRCENGQSTPFPWVIYQDGMANMTFNFLLGNSSSFPIITVDVWTNTSHGGVEVAPVATTPFQVTGQYSFVGGEGSNFEYAEWVANYFRSTVPSHVAAEMTNVFELQFWPAIVSASQSVLSAFSPPGNCPMTMFDVNHLVISTGFFCNESSSNSTSNASSVLPVPATVPASSFLYLIDAGPAPQQQAPHQQHRQGQHLLNCSKVVGIGAPVAAALQLGNCSTQSVIRNSRVVVEIVGTLDFQN